MEDYTPSPRRTGWMMPAVAAIGCGVVLLIAGGVGAFIYFKSRPAGTRPWAAAQNPGSSPAAPATPGSEPATLGDQPGGSESASQPAPAAAGEPESQGPAGQPLRIGVAPREPRKVHNVPRIYPSEARHARVQGIVVLDVTIGAQGRVEDVRVVRSIPMLDEAAIEAVQQWVYEPTYVNGTPTPVVITVPVSFWLPERGEVVVEEWREPEERVIIEERRPRRRGRVIEGEVRRPNY